MDTAQAPGLEAAPSTSPLEEIDKAAEQIALFGRTPSPPAAGPEHVVQVRAHQRVTSSGKVVAVAAHQAHHQGPAAPVQSPPAPAPVPQAPTAPRPPGTPASPEVLAHLPEVRPDGFAAWNVDFESALAQHQRIDLVQRLTPTSWLGETRGTTGAKAGYVQVHADGTISERVQNPDALARRARGHAPEHGRRQSLDKPEVSRILREAGHNLKKMGVVVQSLGDGKRYAVRHEYGTQQDLEVRGQWPADADRPTTDALEERRQEERDRDILKLAEALEQKGLRVTMGPAAWGFHVDRPVQEAEGAPHIGTAPASLIQALHGVGLPDAQVVGFRTGWADIRDQRLRQFHQEDAFASGYRQGRTAAERAASGHPAMLNLLDEHSPAVARKLRAQLEGKASLAKAKAPAAGNHAPPGYEPAPHSRRGYFRRREGDAWLYWHPKQGHITAKSNELHRAELVTDRLEAMHHADIERERATWGDQSAEHVRQSPARYHHSQLQDETGLAKRPVLQALERAVELGWAVKRTSEHERSQRFGLFGRGGTKTMTQTAGYYGPAAPPELAKATQQLSLVSTERRGPALHAPIAQGQARCGRTVLAPSKSGHGRRWQCVDRQGKVVHPPEHRELLARMHRHGGHYPMVRATAERKHVQDLVGQGLVKLRQNPTHHAHEFTATLTAAGHRAVERERAVREADNTRRQGALFKGAGGLLELLAWMALHKASTQAQLFGAATVAHQVRTHTRLTPSGGVALVQQHQAHHRAGRADPAPTPAPAPKSPPALTARDVFRMRRSELDALLREHPGDATLTALVHAEIARREQKRGTPREPTPPPPSVLDKPPEDALSVAELVQNPADVRAAAFQRWFKGSKVRRPDGDPAAQQGPFNAALVVYHGTPVGGFEAFDPTFDKGNNIFGRGFYFTADRAIAAEYTKKDEDKATASARGFLDARGEPIREIDAAQVTELLARHGYQRKPGVGRWTSDPKDYTTIRHPARPHAIGPNPNWSPNVLYAVAVSARPDGSVDLVRFWDEVRHPTQADPARLQRPDVYSGAADLKADLDELARNVIGQDVLAVLGEGARADVPASQLFEVYLSIQKPLDMESPASPEDVRALSIALHRAELERRLPALGDFSSYEEKIRMVREDPYGFHAKESPAERQRWLDQYQGDLDAAKERHAQALADLATLKAGGFVPFEVYADDLIDHKMAVAHYGGNYDIPLEHGALLALKQRVVDGSKEVTHQGRQVLGLLHLTPRDTLTWGDVHYILTNAHHGGAQEKAGFRAWAESQGYDGIRHTGGWNIGTHAHDVWIAWKPEAIKATTAERFDPTTTNLYKARRGWTPRALRLLLALAKARAWTRPGVAQVGLFQRAPVPHVATTQVEPTAPAGRVAPPAPAPPELARGHPEAPQGFQPIAGSTRGGYHRKLADGSYTYWYPEDGERPDIHHEDHEAAARAEGRRASYRLAQPDYRAQGRPYKVEEAVHYVARAPHADPASTQFSYRGHAQDPGAGHDPIAGTVYYGADHEPWELGLRANRAAPYVLTSLRTGERRTFDANYEVRAWHDEQHDLELREASRRRHQEIIADLPAQVQRLEQLRATFDREPTEAHAVALATHAGVLEAQLENVYRTPEQVATLLGVSVDMPKTWVGFLDEYRALVAELQQKAPSGPLTRLSWSGNWTDLLMDRDLARTAARWRYLHQAIGWELSDAYRKDDKPIKTLDVRDVFERIPDDVERLSDEVIRRAVRDALIAEGGKPSGKWLGRTILQNLGNKYTSNPVLLRKAQALARWCRYSDHRREVLLASPLDVEVVRDDVIETHAAERLDRAYREVGASLGNEPVPELYGDAPQAHDLKELAERVTSAAVAQPWYGQEEAQQTAVRRLELLRPDRVTRQNLETGRKVKPAWSEVEMPETQSVPLTRAMRLRLMVHQGQQRGEGFRRAHQERVERLNATMALIRERVGDPTRWQTGALQAVAAEGGVPADLLQQEVARNAQRATPHALDDYEGPLARAWERAHPEAAQRRNAHYALPQEQRSPDVEAVIKADRAANHAFRQRAQVVMARHIREALHAHLQHPTDAAHALASIVPVAEGTLVTHQGQPHPVENYDKEADPNKLGWLLGFVHRDLIPTVDIGHVVWGFRDHCNHSNGLRLTRRKDGSDYEHGDSTIWHEYGHAIEHDSPAIREMANTLRDQRGRGEQRRKLNDVDGRAYEDHETTYKDEWSSAYTGKWYGHQASTEVLSMGVESFMVDPLGMYRTDPEHFYFTVGALAGMFGTERKPSHPRDPARKAPEKA